MERGRAVARDEVGAKGFPQEQRRLRDQSHTELLRTRGEMKPDVGDVREASVAFSPHRGRGFLWCSSPRIRRTGAPSRTPECATSAWFATPPEHVDETTSHAGFTRAGREEITKEVLHPHCAGLDVHKRNVVACVRIAHGGTIDDKTRTFGTTTEQLLALGDWLDEHHVTHAAMEATGVYGKPVWYALDNGERTLTLGNAAHIQNVPGRKTDVNDAQWLCRPSRSRTDPRQLRACAGDARPAGFDAHAQAVGA